MLAYKLFSLEFLSAKYDKVDNRMTAAFRRKPFLNHPRYCKLSSII
jgi:hypothetical protein